MNKIEFKSKWFEKCIRDYLELGEVCLSDLEGADKLMGLEKPSIWSN